MNAVRGALKNKRNKIYFSLAILLLVAGFGLLGVYYYNTTILAPQQAPQEPGAAMQDTSQLGTYLSTLPTQSLNETEKQGILYMREEEKLARDVYLELYDKWGVQIFSNIAHSEQTHMDAVLLLIERYNLTDPVGNDTRGVFTNDTLQNLYNELVANGTKSLEDAYRVGALIEEVDIIDLEDWIAKTDNEDLKTVYGFLMSGSYNHLRAFVKQLNNLGVTYTPVLLPQEQYNEIISGTAGRGSAQPNMETTTTMQALNAYYFYGGIVSVGVGIVFLVLFFSNAHQLKGNNKE